MYLDPVLVMNTIRSQTFSFRSVQADTMNNLINHFLLYFKTPSSAGGDD